MIERLGFESISARYRNSCPSPSTGSATPPGAGSPPGPTPWTADGSLLTSSASLVDTPDPPSRWPTGRVGNRAPTRRSWLTPSPPFWWTRSRKSMGGRGRPPSADLVHHPADDVEIALGVALGHLHAAVAEQGPC